jgi:protein MpaA
LAGEQSAGHLVTVRSAQVVAGACRWVGVPSLLRRRTLLGGLLGGMTAVAVDALDAGPAQAGIVRPAEAGIPQPGRTPIPPRRRLLGRSAQGRPIWVHDLGAQEATATVLVVGSIHGNEAAGAPIARLLLEGTPAPGVRLIVVPTMNPDGDARRRRQNARGVDLNRNFPGGVHRGRPGDAYYSGPRDLSEVESRLMHGLLAAVQPAALVVYHQHLDLVDHCGGSLPATQAYAAETGMRAVRLPRYPGSMATWLHQRQPACTILTVELPAQVGAGMRRRHAAAVARLTQRVHTTTG